MNAYYSLLARFFLWLSYYFASKIEGRKDDFKSYPVLKPVLEIVAKNRMPHASIGNQRREMWRRYLYG